VKRASKPNAEVAAALRVLQRSMDEDLEKRGRSNGALPFWIIYTYDDLGELASHSWYHGSLAKKEE